MAEYIDREAFVESQRHLYCDNCAKRKGMKRGKMRFVYEIGDAPCRSCGYGDVLDDLGDFPVADARETVMGKWITIKHPLYECSVCGAVYQDVGYGFNFCPNCGADMRGE